MKKVYKNILQILGIGVDTLILGWIALWSYHNINLSDSEWLIDIGATALLMFVVFIYASRLVGRLYKKPIYGQLGLAEREQVRQEFYDERYDAEMRRREDEKARERTHKEKEERDAEEAQRALYDRMPERVRLRSTVLRHELQQLGEYDDQEIGGTEEITRICAPIPKFPDKEYYLLRDIADQTAEAIVDKVVGDHAEMLPGGVSHINQWKVRRNLKNNIYEDMVYALTLLDRYYYTPDKIFWTTGDFREAARAHRTDEAMA